MNGASAVQTKKRSGDGFTFYSSHSHCYAIELHAKTNEGRESCRYGRPTRREVVATATVLNVKSPISSNVHARGTVGATSTLCGTKLPINAETVDSADFPVTCKSCLKRSV